MIDRVNFTLHFVLSILGAIPILHVDIKSLAALWLLVDKLFHQFLKVSNLIILIVHLFIHFVHEPFEALIVFLE